MFFPLEDRGAFTISRNKTRTTKALNSTIWLISKILPTGTISSIRISSARKYFFNNIVI